MEKLLDKASFSEKYKIFATVLGIVIFGAILLIYLYSPTSEKQVIKKVFSLPWYSSKQQIMKKLDRFKSSELETEPHLEENKISGEEFTLKNVRLRGDTAYITFVHHPKHGFVKAFLKVKFGRGNDCLETFEKYFTRFNRNYGKYLVKESKSNQIEVSFCQSVLVGKARRFAIWEDPSGTQIHMLVGTPISKRHITIIFETPEYLNWIEKNYLERILSLF